VSRWLEVRLKHLSSVAISNGLGERGEFDDPTWPRYIRTTDIAGPSELRTDTFKSLPPDVAQGAMLVQGDLLMTAAGATIGKSFTFKESYSACFAGYLVRFRPDRRQVDGRFVAYWMQSSVYWAQVDAQRVKSTIENFSASRYQNLKLAVPPLAAQRAIADYLDAETARIDALIEKKRRMVEVLGERWEAAIFHAITRGVSGPRSLVASGLSWVEQLPEGWGTPTVSMNFDLQLGKMLNAEAAGGTDQYAYLRNVNVQWDRLNLDDLATMHFSATDRKRCELRCGDLLICEGGEVGRAAVWNGQLSNCYFQKAIHRVRPRDRANTRYLMYCLWAAACRSVFAVEGNQSTIVHLTGEQLRVHRFPWPSEGEQAAIVAHLDELAITTKALRESLDKQIDLLLEHRQALITASVTGELPIPEVAA